MPPLVIACLCGLLYFGGMIAVLIVIAKTT